MASALVKMGFANSTGIKTYSAGIFEEVMETGATPLQVPLTGFTPGNIILIGYSFSALDSISSGPAGISYDVRATIDVNGGGQKAIVSDAIGINMISTSPVILTENASGWMTFYKPPAIDVTQDPVIGLIVKTTGSDSIRIAVGNALIWAVEVAAAFATQYPTTTLEP